MSRGFVRLLVPALLAAGMIGAILPYGAGRFFETARLAIQLRTLSFPQRKVALIGAWFAEVERLRRDTSSDVAIDLVMIDAGSRDVAVLAAAALRPRDCRLFDGWDAWRRRERAVLFQGAHSANASPGRVPARAPILVSVDVSAAAPFRVVGEPE